MQKSIKIVLAVVLTISIGCGLLYVWPNALPLLMSIYLLSEWSDADIRFTVSSTGDDRPVFTFDQTSIDYRRHPFNNFEVVEVFPSKPEDPKLVGKLTENQKYGKGQLFR
jgi:hypothetical protein